METETSIAGSQTTPKAVGGARWWGAVAAGVLASLPIGWLLSYGGSLPFMLGAFFFALFGLVVGAVTYRVGLAARPVPVGQLKCGVAVVVLVCWGVSMAVEVHEFPTDKAKEALPRIAPLPEGMTAESMKADVAAFVRSTLREKYGGDGLIGYARWILDSSRIEYSVATMKNPIVLGPAQRRGWWALRVIMCIGLLTFGVFSQVGPLAGDGVERADDGVDRPPPDQTPAGAA